MPGRLKRVLPVLLVLAAIGAGVYFYMQTSASTGALTVSGSIEATQIKMASVQGGRVAQVNLQEGDQVTADQIVAVVQAGNSSAGGREMIHSPINGVVLYRTAEPGEVVAAGAPLLTLINPDDLSLTVYVPEDRYGAIKLGQVYSLTVDSFPNEVFTGTVTHIADQAEFTPRNVQTTDNRKTTVFAVKLDVSSYDGKLKPGMPADVHFALQS